jgi:hypothetical protein
VRVSHFPIAVNLSPQRVDLVQESVSIFWERRKIRRDQRFVASADREIELSYRAKCNGKLCVDDAISEKR